MIEAVTETRIKLTARQQEIYDYIVWFIQTNNLPPSVREICDQFDIKSPNGAKIQLLAIERKGWIELIPKVARGIRLTTGATCPCCGRSIATTTNNTP